jgi:hypothetical protein
MISTGALSRSADQRFVELLSDGAGLIKTNAGGPAAISGRIGSNFSLELLAHATRLPVVLG